MSKNLRANGRQTLLMEILCCYSPSSTTAPVPGNISCIYFSFLGGGGGMAATAKMRGPLSSHSEWVVSSPNRVRGIIWSQGPFPHRTGLPPRPSGTRTQVQDTEHAWMRMNAETTDRCWTLLVPQPSPHPVPHCASSVPNMISEKNRFQMWKT